jgi:predicted trehalose synthase
LEILKFHKGANLFQKERSACSKKWRLCSKMSAYVLKWLKEQDSRTGPEVEMRRVMRRILRFSLS